MQVGELYHSQEHGLIVIRKVTLTHQSMAGAALYKVVYQVIADESRWSAHITRDSWRMRFKSLSL